MQPIDLATLVDATILKQRLLTMTMASTSEFTFRRRARLVCADLPRRCAWKCLLHQTVDSWFEAKYELWAEEELAARKCSCSGLRALVTCNTACVAMDRLHREIAALFEGRTMSVPVCPTTISLLLGQQPSFSFPVGEQGSSAEPFHSASGHFT